MNSFFGPSKTRKYEGLNNEAVWAPRYHEEPPHFFGWIDFDSPEAARMTKNATICNVGDVFSVSLYANAPKLEVAFADVWSMKDAAVQSYTPRKK